MDKESESLSFPTIYCGQTRAKNKERTTPVSGLGENILNFLQFCSPSHSGYVSL